MNKLESLKEQAKVLRMLAASFDMPDIRDQLLAMAEKCEALAEATQEAPEEEALESPRVRTSQLFRG
jgi:hypothetical protein